MKKKKSDELVATNFFFVFFSEMKRKGKKGP